MNPLLAASLNLLVNAAVAFALSFLLVLGVLRLLRVPPGRLRLAFLLLPVAKLLWDLGRGIPAGSFLWAHLSGITRESGSLMLGVGATSTLGVKLRGVMTANAAGEQYGLSLGDLAMVGCDRLWAGLAGAVVIALGLVSTALLLRRAVAAWRFGADRRRAHLEGVLWRRCRVGARTVPVYLRASSGELPVEVPYAAGWLRPYVCFPVELFASMAPAEREAALQHELAHIAQHHWVLRGLVDALACVFWFVPGMRALTHRIADECELMADDSALGGDVDSTVLATALVKAVGQLGGDGRRAMPIVPLGRSEPRLISRVKRLLARTATPAPTRTIAALWLMAFAITAQSVLLMVVGTNG